ncbi:MAG: glycine oxidase ThiO [Gammaproteobacteria bacterium]|nr:MAG: glycine oxidase ThiO [Gammaproteobacteria bacterium]
MKAIIVGAGVMGMMLARELGQAGMEVLLLERRACGREASWAGGGIVSPLYPWRYHPAITALTRWSQHYYPNLVQTLDAETGLDAEISHAGLLMVSVADRDQALDWARANDYRMDDIQGAALHELEPALSKAFSSGLWMPQVASVRNPRLCRALRASLARLPNVCVRETCEVSGLVIQAGRAKGVLADSGAVSGDRVILAAGAWTGRLLEPLGLTLPVVPVKGQMIAFGARPRDVRHIVLADGRYVIPRRDGLVVAGSTLEHTDFSKTPTEEAREALRDAAIRMIPSLASCPVVAHWAGLRPGSPQGIPFIGEVPGVRGLYVNAGHYRNGLVTAPASVALLKALLLEEASPVDPAPYALDGRLEAASLEEA